MFTEIGRHAIEGDIKEKPFQDLIYVVRDYQLSKLSHKKSSKKREALNKADPSRSWPFCARFG